MTNETHKIYSFEQLLNAANSENAERLILDFASWLNMYLASVNLMRKQFPEETKGKTNYEIAKSGFIWTDDGENKITSIKTINTKTGETHEVKIN